MNKSRTLPPGASAVVRKLPTKAARAITTDTLTLLAGLPALTLEPGGGPGLLFVSTTTVFQSMGAAGKIFQLAFWLLVFFAALSSSIGMMEAGISAILDSRVKALL